MRFNKKFNFSYILLIVAILISVYPNLSLGFETSCSGVFGLTQSDRSVALLNEFKKTDINEIQNDIYETLVHTSSSNEKLDLRLKKSEYWPKVKSLINNLNVIQKELSEILSSYNEFSKIHPNTRKLLVKILADPKYKHTEEEIKMIARDETLASTLDYTRNFSIKNSKLASTYASLIKVNKGLFWVMFIGSIVLKSEILNGATESSDLDNSPLQSDQIEIIYLSPAPHTEIRVGNTIYNYGPGLITKMSYKESLELNNNWLYRSSTRVRLNLSHAEMGTLVNYLEGEVGKVYTWIPKYPSPTAFLCVAASHRAIEQNTSIIVPAGIDRSPILSEAYFAGRFFMGDPKVAGVYYSNRGKADPFVDLGFGLFDSSVGLAFLWINALAAQADYLPNSLNLSK